MRVTVPILHADGERRARCVSGYRPSATPHIEAKEGVAAGTLPTSTNNRANDTPIDDQGQVGCCTAMATVGVMKFLRKRFGLAAASFAWLALYWWTRVSIEQGDPSLDNGAMGGDAVKAAEEFGIPTTAAWPSSDFAAQPSDAAKTDAALHRFQLRVQLPTLVAGAPCLDHLKASLAEGFPFVFGMPVDEAFMSDTTASTGVAAPPSTSPVAGGHEMMAIDYDDGRGAFFVRNSWGEDWGEEGYVWIPYGWWLSLLAGDCWSPRVLATEVLS